MLRQLSNDQLVRAMKTLVLEERKITRQILEHINEIERRRLYADLGFPSAFEWLTRDLGYSESAAYRRLTAARALRVVPEVAHKIETGELNLTTVANAQSIVRAEEKRTGEKIDRTEVLKLIESKSSREAEQILATMFPQAVVSQEKFRAVGEDEVRIEVVLKRTQMEKLNRVRELTSHSQFGASLAEIIGLLTEEFIKRHDPLVREIKRREQREAKPISSPLRPQGASARSAATRSPVSQSNATRSDDRINSNDRRVIETNSSKSIRPSSRNSTFKRSKGCCEFRDAITGRVCGSRFQVQIDHRYPRALGGTNAPENLRVLCRTHNLLMARRLIGTSY